MFRVTSSLFLPILTSYAWLYKFYMSWDSGQTRSRRWLCQTVNCQYHIFKIENSVTLSVTLTAYTCLLDRRFGDAVAAGESIAVVPMCDCLTWCDAGREGQRLQWCCKCSANPMYDFGLWVFYCDAICPHMPIGMARIYRLLFVFLFVRRIFVTDISGVGRRRVIKFCRMAELGG